jgi:hypothetical protein
VNPRVLRQGAVEGFRHEVRTLLVPFVRVLALGFASRALAGLGATPPSASPRRATSTSLVRLSWCHGRICHEISYIRGVFPAMNGAPQHQIRLVPPLAAGHSPPPTLPQHQSCLIRNRRLILDRTRVKPAKDWSTQPWHGCFQRKPRVSLNSQAGPPTLGFSLRIGPGFFVLA